MLEDLNDRCLGKPLFVPDELPHYGAILSELVLYVDSACADRQALAGIGIRKRWLMRIWIRPQLMKL